MSDNSEFGNHVSRPSWQSQNCPPWCVAFHDEEDAPCERFHMSEEWRVALNRFGTANATVLSEGFTPDWITLHLVQPIPDHVPHVWIGADESAHGFHLALPEAQHVAALLFHVSELARMRR